VVRDSFVLRGDVLENHDLARAVRDAIGAIIQRAAKDIPDEKQRAALEKMAHSFRRLTGRYFSQPEALPR
jgi:hypothetical protein